MTRNPVTVLSYPHGMAKLTWITCFDKRLMNKYRPFNQVYGVCFNKSGEILVINEKGDGRWKIPGGTPEEGETPEETLTRELMEEADVALRQLLPVGAQLVEDPNNPDADKRRYYQLRYAGIISELKEQTPDPDGGKIYPRKFVPSENINQLVGWGKTGEAMFADATSVIASFLEKIN